MDAIRQYLSAGQLQQAIEQAQQALRQAPGASDLRAALVELLCLVGQLERADDVLTSLANHYPDWFPGAANMRQLLRAQQARLALRQGQLTDDVVAAPGASLEALLALNLHLFSGQLDHARAAAAALEASREPCIFQVGPERGEIRDCDDSLNGYVEGLGTDGRYYLWQWSEIQALRFHAPASPVELVWRRAELELADGRQGEAFIPLTYIASSTDRQQLGQETDWVEHASGLVTGVGLKLYLVGDAGVALDGSRRVERYRPVEARDAV
jgi:type VI secretion system protein ImpE